MNRTVSDTASAAAATLGGGEHEDIHVEIEHVPGDDEDTGGGLDSDGDCNLVDTSPCGGGGGNNATIQHPMGKIQLYTRVQGKRTVILQHQRKILEEFYRTGMTSASHNLHHLHEAAADQTGLELYVIKNWVRNRRRPSAAQKRMENTTQDVGSSLSNASLLQQPLTTLSNILPNVTTVTIPTPPQIHQAPALIVSDPKRPCLDSLLNSDGSSISGKPFVVKVRIADSGECDFVEVDVNKVSYLDLLKCCCEELQVSLDDVSKIRKLPNVLIRKDKDVARLTEGQELELVLKGGSVSQTLMALHPFSGNSSVQLIPLMNAENNGLLSIDASHQSNEGGTTNTNNHS